MIDADIALVQGDFTLNLALRSDAAVTALTGPSGCGKTSVLDVIAGLRRAGGHVRVMGETLAAPGLFAPPEARGLGYVFQDARLFPHLSVRANLAYGARGGDVSAIAEELGIGRLLDRWPRHLSGGEARRVAIGRAVLRRPRLLLLDEPTAHLDAARAAEVVALIARLAERTPVLLASHAPHEVAALGARIVAMGV